jgi:caffeoyl-CoA O-methyltransferase
MDLVNRDAERYATEHTSPLPDHLHRVFESTTANHQDAGMMVGRLEGTFLELLVFGLRPAVVLEIGTFTGFSAISMAAGLPEGGRIITCEFDPEHAADSRRNIAASPYADRIELVEGPALETIAGLPGPFNFVFIDADKTGYPAYYEAVIPKLAPGGLIAADNTLFHGSVLDPEDNSDSALALRAFNDRVASDPRVRAVQLTVRDGVTLIRLADGASASVAPG